MGSAPSGDAISAAAKKLSDASYPFLKGIDWNSDLYIKPLPGVTAQKALKAVDKTIVMGAAMDGNALKAGAEAHHKAIGSIDGSGVTSASDYEAVNNAIGHMVASVPTSKVMDVSTPGRASSARLCRTSCSLASILLMPTRRPRRSTSSRMSSRRRSAKRILPARSRFIYETSRVFDRSLFCSLWQAMSCTPSKQIYTKTP